MNEISSGVLIPSGAEIGNGVRIGPQSILTQFVTLESNVIINAGVVFEDGGPDRTFVRRSTRIGAGSTIAQGITIGRGAEACLGSVVLESVPPNAIVKGNPAQIIGYTTGLNNPAASCIVSPSSFTSSNVASIIPLEVSGAALYLTKKVTDLRGALTVGEFAADLPFIPRRYFIVFDVPSLELRGEHAHRECHEFLICVRGSCRVLLDDGYHRQEILLDRPNAAVHMPPMIWGTQHGHSADAALLVFCSHEYDASDYVRVYDEFLDLRYQEEK